MVLGVMGVFTVFSFQTRAMNKELAEYPVRKKKTRKIESLGLPPETEQLHEKAIKRVKLYTQYGIERVNLYGSI